MAKKKTSRKPKPKAAAPLKQAKPFRRTLTPEQIAKMQAGRKASKAGFELAKRVQAAKTHGSVSGLETAGAPAVHIVQVSTVFDPNMGGKDAAVKGGIWMFGLGSDNRIYFWSFSEGRWIPNWLQPQAINLAPVIMPKASEAVVDPLS